MRCQVKVSATRRSLVQRSPTECSVSVSYRGTSTMRRPRPTRAMNRKNKITSAEENLMYRNQFQANLAFLDIPSVLL